MIYGVNSRQKSTGKSRRPSTKAIFPMRLIVANASIVRKCVTSVTRRWMTDFDEEEVDMNDCNCIDCQYGGAPSRYSHLRSALLRLTGNKTELNRLRKDLRAAGAWFPAAHVRYACSEVLRQPNILSQVPEGHPAQAAWERKEYEECASQVMWYIAFTHAGVE